MTKKPSKNGAARLVLAFCLTIAAALAIAAPLVAQVNGNQGITVLYKPFSGKDATLAKYKPFSDHLAASMGVPVKSVSFEHTDEMFVNLNKGNFDVAYLSPMTFVEATAYANLEVVAMEQYLEGGRGYHSILITRKDRAGKDGDMVLAFTNPHSTSGFLLPQFYFHVILKKAPEEVASKIEFAGDHASVIKGVYEGKYDMGATNDVDFEAVTKELGLPADRFVVVWKSDAIPGSPVCLNPALPPERKEKIRKAIFDMNQDKAALAPMGVVSYRKADVSDYEIMFKVKDAVKF